MEAGINLTGYDFVVIGLFVDHRIEADIDIGFVADTGEFGFQVRDLNRGRQREITRHFKDAGAGDRVVVYIGGDIINIDTLGIKHLADLMHNTGTVQRDGDEFIGYGRLNLAMRRSLGFMHIDIKPCFFPEAVQLADEALDIIGLARSKDDHTEFVAQHAASRTFNIDTASGEEFRNILD